MSMTVAELIEKLKEMPQDQEVCVLGAYHHVQKLTVVAKLTRSSSPYHGYLPMEFVLLEGR